jgi:hypothetical protein
MFIANKIAVGASELIEIVMKKINLAKNLRLYHNYIIKVSTKNLFISELT